MKKIWSGLRYGNTKTKTYIIGILLLLIFGAFSIGMVLATSHPLWGMGAAFSVLTAIILMQSVSFRKVGEIKKLASHKKKPQDKVEKVDKQAAKAKAEQEDKLEATAKVEEEEEEVAEPEVYLQQYDEKKIKGVFVKYKVNKQHYPIMVDSCPTYKIHQCPAYAWMEKGALNLLLFEKEPRKVTISAQEVQEITYEQKVLVNAHDDYTGFSKPSFINMVFTAYLPSVYEDTIAGRRSYRKNLYVIGQDLKVTNTSAATMLRMLSVNLSVKRQIRDSAYQNPYFEAAYALNLMLKDTVITVNEFKTGIKDVLQKLTDSKIRKEEFMDYMNQLIQGRLITREYAQYYIEQKNKN